MRWLWLLVWCCLVPELAVAELRPNLVFVLCDDLGYGDVSCLNPQGKLQTVQMDRLAREGMIFTDAHSGSAVCTPTRYGLMTGRYAWRSRLQRGVLGGLSPRLIEPDRLTVASFLKSQGYHTACIGKWHLGMDWVKRTGKEVTELNIETPEQVGNVDYSQPIQNGPNAVGFDEYFGISASLDMVPYTFIEDDHVPVLPTETCDFAMMLGRSNGRTRTGPTAPGFDANQVLPTLTERAIEYIGSRAEAVKSGTPFFLYLPLASPHTPILPTAPWLGKSGLNSYGDFVLQTDDAIGQVLAALDQHGLAENTLIIVTSDNGCSPQAQFEDLIAQGHDPSAQFRGTKADIFEGGHRVPFLARWPGKVPAGSQTEQLVCLTDFLATCAEILEVDLPQTAGEDSHSFWPTLLNPQQASPRQDVVHHSINGSFAIRQGDWKLCLCPDSGGWSAPKPNAKSNRDLPPVQLYNLRDDVGEQNNLAGDLPDQVSALQRLLEEQVNQGRSTPGAPQQNAVQVEWNVRE